MSKFSGINIKTSDVYGFQFYQSVLIPKVMEDTLMDH